MSRLDQIQAVLDDNPSATAADLQVLLHEYDKRDIAAVLAANLGGAPGGSGTVRVIGPFHLDFTDFPTELSTVTLFTPDLGDIIIKGFGDPATAVSFDDSGSMDFAIGADPPGPDFDNSVGFWGFLGNGIGAPDTAFPDTDNGSNTMVGNHQTGIFVSTGQPIKIVAKSVVGDGMAGQMDLYFLVATPTAP